MGLQKNWNTSNYKKELGATFTYKGVEYTVIKHITFSDEKGVYKILHCTKCVRFGVSLYDTFEFDKNGVSRYNSEPKLISSVLLKSYGFKSEGLFYVANIGSSRKLIIAPNEDFKWTLDIEQNGKTIVLHNSLKYFREVSDFFEIFDLCDC